MSLRRAFLAAVSIACGLAFAGAGQASVTYVYERLTDTNPGLVVGFSYTSADFLSANTTVSPGDLDSCSAFASQVCDDQILYVDTSVLFNGAYAVIRYGYRTPLSRGGSFSYFTEGALGAAGVYHAVLLDFDHSILTVTDNGTGGGGVPEPATWAVMLVGFAGIGAALRRRRPRAA